MATIKELEARIEKLRDDNVIDFKFSLLFLILLSGLAMKVFFFTPPEHIPFVKTMSFGSIVDDIERNTVGIEENYGDIRVIKKLDYYTQKCYFYGIHKKGIKNVVKPYYSYHYKKIRCQFILDDDTDSYVDMSIVTKFNDFVRSLKTGDNNESKD